MKIQLPFFLFLFAANLLSAQYAFTKKWDKRYGGVSGDGCTYFVTTKDHGFVLGGVSQSTISGDKTQSNRDTTLHFGDYWAVKIDQNGNKEWDRRYGGYSQDNLSVIRQTADDGFIWAGGSGTTSAGADKTEAGRGNWDYWIVKTDAQGNKQWDRRFGGFSVDYLLDIQQTKDKGYILGGYSSSPIGGDKTQADWDASGFYWDYWVVKIDSIGNKELDKRFGGIEDEKMASVIQSNDGGYMLFGSSSSGSTGDRTQSSRGYSDYWIVKIDSLGIKEWDKRYGGNNGDYLNAALSISGGYLLGGNSYSDSGGDKTQDNWSGDLDYWIVKIDSSGNKVWDKTFGGLGEDALKQVTSTLDGGFLLAGGSYSSTSSGDKSESNLGSRQTWLVKVDSSGSKEWDKTIFTNGSEVWGLGIQTPDGCYLAGGYTEGGIGGYKTQPNWDSTNLTPDYWVIKFCMEPYNSIDDGQLTIDNSKIQIQTYPNPFTTDLSIALKGEGTNAPVTFTITDIMGRVIYKREESNLAPGYTKMLDLSYLANGVYFVTVAQGGEVFTKKVVKE